MTYQTYIVSFEIHSGTIGNYSYADRYGSLMQAIKSFAFNWTETTSFASIHADRTLHEMLGVLYIGTHVNAAYDKILIAQLGTGDAFYKGPTGTHPGQYHFNLL